MSRAPQVLVVDDDAAVGLVLASLLKQGGFDASHVDSAAKALLFLEQRPADAVITDLQMPGMDGMGLLKEIQARWAGLPVVMLTAHGTIPLAVEAMRLGGADFLLKPFDREEILYTVRRATARPASELPPESSAAPRLLSPAMQEINRIVQRASQATATVLIRGETGSGKEVVARMLHEQSPRSRNPFVKVLCSALPENLLESELFGYEKGAFTGAAARKPGRVELAEGGTLFIDEVGELPLALQVKLLRFLQDREFERLGGAETLKADVRILAATHQPLEERIRQGTFREDFFYRLNVVPIRVPPLRERREELPSLANHFVKTFSEANGRPPMSLAPEALEFLTALPWPGNVRQLQNFLERLVILHDGPVLTRETVAAEWGRLSSELGVAPVAADDGQAKRPGLLDQRRAAERQAVEESLRNAKGNRTLAARLLGVSRRTLYNKLEEFGLG